MVACKLIWLGEEMSAKEVVTHTVIISRCPRPPSDTELQLVKDICFAEKVEKTTDTHHVCPHCNKPWPTVSEMGMYERPASLAWYCRLVNGVWPLDDYCCDATQIDCESGDGAKQ